MNTPITNTSILIVFLGSCLALSSRSLALEEDTIAPAETLTTLTADLEEPDYLIANAARRMLSDVLNAGGPKAKEAKSILDDHSRRTIEWLVEMGNNREALLNPMAPVRELHILMEAATPARSFRYLLSTPKLRVLGVQGKHVKDDHLIVLSHMPMLGLLDIHDTAVTGTSLEHLVLPSLEILRVSKCPLSGEAICKVEFPNLRLLDISYTPITNETIAKLKVKHIRELHIEGTRVTSAGVAQIRAFDKLRMLQCDGEDVSKESIEVMKSMRSLKKIRLICDDEEERRRAEALLSDLEGECEVEFRVRPVPIKKCE